MKGKVRVIPEQGEEFEVDFDDLVEEENESVSDKMKRCVQSFAQRFFSFREQDNAESSEELTTEDMEKIMYPLHLKDAVANKIEAALSVLEWEPREAADSMPGYYTGIVRRVSPCDLDNGDWTLCVELVSKYEDKEVVKATLTEFLENFQPTKELTIKNYDA